MKKEPAFISTPVPMASSSESNSDVPGWVSPYGNKESQTEQYLEAIAESNLEPRTAAEQVDEEPRERFHFGVPRDKTKIYRKDPNFNYHIVNDDPGRLDEALMGGYRFVLRSEITLQDGVTPLNVSLDDNVSIAAGTNGSGQPRRAYLMKCPMHIKKETDRIYREEINGPIMKSILEGDVQTKGGGMKSDKFYAKGIESSVSNKLD